MVVSVDSKGHSGFVCSTNLGPSLKPGIAPRLAHVKSAIGPRRFSYLLILKDIPASLCRTSNFLAITSASRPRLGALPQLPATGAPRRQTAPSHHNIPSQNETKETNETNETLLFSRLKRRRLAVRTIARRGANVPKVSLFAPFRKNLHSRPG
jgi:hypothetical protein